MSLKISLKTELFGQSPNMLLYFGLIGMAGMYARRGETQAARAAKAAGIPFCLSSLTICDVDEVAKVEPPWFQLSTCSRGPRLCWSSTLARATAAK